jgi:hypothetical protein
MVTPCTVAPHHDTTAVNAALVAFAGTVTEDGTATAVLFVARATVSPLPVAAALSVTVQVSSTHPVIDRVVQVRALGTGVLANRPRGKQRDKASMKRPAIPLLNRKTRAKLLARG